VLAGEVLEPHARVELVERVDDGRRTSIVAGVTIAIDRPLAP
jgi:hypothetical protein